MGFKSEMIGMNGKRRWELTVNQVCGSGEAVRRNIRLYVHKVGC